MRVLLLSRRILKMTVQEAFNNYILFKRASSLSEATINDYKYHLLPFLRFLVLNVRFLLSVIMMYLLFLLRFRNVGNLKAQDIPICIMQSFFLSGFIILLGLIRWFLFLIRYPNSRSRKRRYIGFLTVI